jgi:hypothetical protein
MAQSQPRCALQLPEQAPEGPRPLQLPPPPFRDSRPDPCALPAPPETETLTLPFEETRPDMLPAPPPETTPLLIVTP